MTDIYMTTMHGDDQGADDARKRGDALLIWDDTGTDHGYVLRLPDGTEREVVSINPSEAWDEAHRILDRL